MQSSDEAMIQQLLDELSDAWNRGDAKAYGARVRADATFTNVNGMFHESRDEFDRRHEEIFRGVFKGTTLSLRPRKVRFIRPDIAIVDTECGVYGSTVRPPGVQAGTDGALRTCLMLVLVKESGSWWIDAYHNVWLASVRYDSTGKA